MTTIQIGDKVTHKAKGKTGTVLRPALAVGRLSNRWYVRWSDNSETHVHENDLRLTLETFSWQRSPSARWSAIHLRKPGALRTICGKPIPAIRYDDSRSSAGLWCAKCEAKWNHGDRSEPLSVERPDFAVQNEGTIVLLRPLTAAGQGWIDEHLPAERTEWAGAVVIEPRYVTDILEGITNDGLSFS